MDAYPHTLLVDLDDTILNYGASAEASWRAVCVLAAQRVETLDAGALFAEIDRVRRWYWSDADRHREGRADLRAASARIAQQALADLGCEQPDLARDIAERYRDLREAALDIFPGAVDALERVRARGVRLGLLTNGTGPAQRRKIERFDLARHFDHIQIEGEFGCGKPDPRVYVAALAALGARPESSWMVGDNLEWDVAAPQRLGLRGIWLDGARAGLPAGTAVQPDRIIHALSEF
jgi:putative hydrolase of the HAD superfamily